MEQTLPIKERISSIDTARGIIMVIMALDHVRDFFHSDALAFSPTDLTKTNTALFFTRWITHFCAPTFALLAGVSIYLSLQKKSRPEMAAFLITRGLWLAVLELIVLRFGFLFNFYFDITFFSILWVLGLSMIFMAGLIFLSDKIVLALGLVITFGHNLLDGISLNPDSPMNLVWTTLMRAGFFTLSPDHGLFVSYPVVPWLGVMILGYSLGKVYLPGFGTARRQRILIGLSILTTCLFILLRLINVYGDPAPWVNQQEPWYTFLSFLNCTKYPISLLFILMTLGPVFLLLAGLEKVKSNAFKAFQVIGGVPLFYFILHFYFAHIVALTLFMFKTGKSFSELDFHFNKSFGGITTEGGYSLPFVYVAWISIVLALYPLCLWYNRFKSRHTYKWLSYL